MAKLRDGLTVYRDGFRSYLVTTTIDNPREWARLYNADDELGPPVMVGSVAAHSRYSDWRPVAAVDIPPRLLELLAPLAHLGEVEEADFTDAELDLSNDYWNALGRERGLS